jgi:hypothetical protein
VQILGFSNPEHLNVGRLPCSPFWLRSKAFLFCPFFFWGKIIGWEGPVLRFVKFILGWPSRICFTAMQQRAYQLDSFLLQKGVIPLISVFSSKKWFKLIFDYVFL